MNNYTYLLVDKCLTVDRGHFALVWNDIDLRIWSFGGYRNCEILKIGRGSRYQLTWNIK